MVFYSCFVGGDSGAEGAKFEETVLWTNPSPSADFAAQDVTLSDDINNYDFIAVDIKYLKTSADTELIGKVYYKVSDYKTFAGSAGSPIGVCVQVYNVSYAYLLRRVFLYKSDTELTFGHCFLGGDTNAYNNFGIPMHVYGCKVIPQITPVVAGDMEETVLWENSSPSSTYGGGDVTLSDNVNNYDYIAIDFNLNYTQSQYQTVMGKVYYSVDDYKQLNAPASNVKTGIFGFSYSASAPAYRQFYYKSDTVLTFGIGYAGGTAAGWVIPLHVYGYKLVNSSGAVETSQIPLGGGKLTASSSWNTTQWSPSYALNNFSSLDTITAGSAWIAANSTVGEWLKYNIHWSDVGEVVNKLAFYEQNNGTFSSTVKFKFQGSLDDSTWTDLTSELTVTANSLNEFDIDNDNKYKYYRIYFTTAIQNSGNGYAMIANLMFYGPVPLLNFVDAKFVRDVKCKNSAQTFHTRNAMFTSGYVSTGTTQAKYLQGMLIDGVLNVYYNYGSNYTVTFDPLTDTLSIQLTGSGLNETEGANLQIMYDEIVTEPDNSGLVNVGTVSANQKFTLGYKPSRLITMCKCADTNCMTCVYDEAVSTTNMTYYYSNTVGTIGLGVSGHEGLYSIDDDGFTWSNYTNTYVQYIAYR